MRSGFEPKTRSEGVTWRSLWKDWPVPFWVSQVVGTMLAAFINLGTAWWLLTSVENICHPELLPVNSPWTCPGDRVFFDASVIWGLIGPQRQFGNLGLYDKVNWFFLFGALAPVPFWLASRRWPEKKWILYFNMPIFIAATGIMPPATPVNFTSWFVIGFIFNYYIFKYRKGWWQRYNYVMSAALDAGLAFMGVLLYFALQLQEKSINWWGVNLDNCPLATCPTAPGVVVDGCPTVTWGLVVKIWSDLKVRSRPVHAENHRLVPMWRLLPPPEPDNTARKVTRRDWRMHLTCPHCCTDM